METVEARFVRDTCDADDLGRERVVGRRRVGGVDLEFLWPSVDARLQFRDQRAVGRSGWHDAAGKQDHLPTTFTHLDAPIVE